MYHIHAGTRPSFFQTHSTGDGLHAQTTVSLRPLIRRAEEGNPEVYVLDVVSPHAGSCPGSATVDTSVNFVSNIPPAADEGLGPAKEE